MVQKRKVPSEVEITLTHLPDDIVAVEEILGKVLKIKYVDHDVANREKFPYFT